MEIGNIKRGFKYSLLLLTLSAVAIAQHPAKPAAALADRLREHVTYLASDKLAGRRTGSSGANEAAQYIAGEFKRYGLRPVVQVAQQKAGSLERYQQQFPYVAGVDLEKGNILSTRATAKGGAMNLQVGEDWMPLGFSQNGSVDIPEGVFVGYGITASELKHDDYANGIAKDKLAIALSGTPDGDNPHGQFARYEEVRWKAIAARNAGARALLVIAREPNFKDDRLSQLRYDNSAGDAGIVVLAISQPAALRVFGVANMAVLTNLAAGGSQSADSSNPAVANLGFFNCFQRITTDIRRNEVAAANVVGILEGSDPQLKNEAIVIGAHYDHLGTGGEGSLAPRSGEIHHGADDNASGTAGLLELARSFSLQTSKPRRTLIFIAFSGEEEGLLGSNYYVNHPLFPIANTVAMLNMDMIGRMKDNKLIVGGVGTAPDWRSMIQNANVLQGLTVSATASPVNGSAPPRGSYPLIVSANGRPVVNSDPAKHFQLTLNEDGFGPSDHSSFYAKQVPVLFFWTGTHEDYHKPTDTADKINYADEARIVAMVAQLVSDVDKSDKRPTYLVVKSDSTGRSTGFRISLGTIPNYGDASDGLLLDGVRDDSPASKAGLKAGDKIVKLAGRDIRNVYDYTYAMGEMKAGQEYEVEVMRGNERLKMKVTPVARK
jgi:aminopeptidase YwaD